MSDRVWTPREVADRLQVSEVTVRRLVKQGHLERLAGLGVLRIPDRSLEVYLGHDGRAGSGDDRPDQGDAVDESAPDHI